MVDISICLCTFNRADQLRNALNSLFAQRTEGVFTFEIIIVDDGSTDATPDVVDNARTLSPVPIRYVQQTNSGIATARNRSVKEATGAWVAFFDDDQVASTEWLLRLFCVAMKTGAECVGGPCLLMVPEGSKIQPVDTVRKLLGENPFMMNAPTYFSRLHPVRKTAAIPGTGNALVKKDVFLRLGGFQEDLHYGEDFEFFHKVARSGVKMDIAPDAVIHQVIPASRLQLSYLLPLAEKGAQGQADHDWKNSNLTRLLFMAALRCVHLACWTIPSLFVVSFLNKQDWLLAKRCSLRFSLTYLRRIIDHLASKVTDDE
jgi:succinoglycan biosynthesis protein ExoM